ncbi:hypothetical protein [Methylobacterium sp. AMS5]|uniref:hypothetical protein n=1 Tax=Methylobacterium sp. AMS5 TaxID=925818 RepID=UPI00074F90FD|nr:hypothetical protein [Methylobacterium sp. AMS5]AMB48297.1 hypothetical protein Y590_25350 [Methylobacterium sp. AMS5]
MSNNVAKNEAVTAYKLALTSAFDAREAYERENNANENIFKTFKSLRADFASDVVCEVMHTANVAADFINRQERRNKRFNVYSAEKVFNVARAAVKAEALNVYSKHVFLTALNLTKADKSMTHADAQASLCDALKCDATKEQLISRYARSIAASTADTQSSSSINALQMFDVLTETRDDMNKVAYKLNLSATTTKRLAKALNVAL